MFGWWRRLSHVGKMAGVVGAITGAIVGMAAAWPIVEWIIPAHRSYARDFTLEKIGGVQTTTNELLLWKFEDTKNKVTADKSGWGIQLQKEQDPQTQQLIKDRIKQLDSDERQIDERIRKLKGQ